MIKSSLIIFALYLKDNISNVNVNVKFNVNHVIFLIFVGLPWWFRMLKFNQEKRACMMSEKKTNSSKMLERIRKAIKKEVQSR